MQFNSPGFNEAEAHAPRIRSAGLRSSKTMMRCFNEAEAHAPRIRSRTSRRVTVAPRRFNEAEAHAPRIRSRTSRRFTVAPRRFNEAEAHAPRILDPKVMVTLLDRVASMRPRRMRLGYQQWGFTTPILVDEASMRPRRMRLGYRCNNRPGIPAGKSFNEAEAHAPRIRAGATARVRAQHRLQ